MHHGPDRNRRSDDSATCRRLDVVEVQASIQGNRAGNQEEGGEEERLADRMRMNVRRPRLPGMER